MTDTNLSPSAQAAVDLAEKAFEKLEKAKADYAECHARITELAAAGTEAQAEYDWVMAHPALPEGYEPKGNLAPAVSEAPKKRRGRPTKAEQEAKRAAEEAAAAATAPAATPEPVAAPSAPVTAPEPVAAPPVAAAPEPVAAPAAPPVAAQAPAAPPAAASDPFDPFGQG